MFRNLSILNIARKIVVASFVMVLMLSIRIEVFGQGAEQMLKQAGTYQAADDTSDRASDLYRQVIEMYPKSREAESAQFSLGSYYTRKFFILQERKNFQDWDSFNKAEEALETYRGTYPHGVYLSDSFHTLGLIALRRGDTKRAWSLWTSMKEAAGGDHKIYIGRLPWLTSTDNVVRGYCDTASLANVSLNALGQNSSFDAVVNEITNWARQNCTSTFTLGDSVNTMQNVAPKRKRPQ